MVDQMVHRDQSRVYLERSKEAFSREDFLQASEKGWGASSQIIKALAERRGWEHWSHWRLSSAVSQLVEETGDDEFRILYAVANQLHNNFYEGQLSATIVEKSLQDVERFIGKVEALLDLG